MNKQKNRNTDRQPDGQTLICLINIVYAYVCSVPISNVVACGLAGAVIKVGGVVMWVCRKSLLYRAISRHPRIALRTYSGVRGKTA